MLPIFGACALDEIGALFAGVFCGVLRSMSVYCSKETAEEETYGAVTSRLPGILLAILVLPC